MQSCCAAENIKFVHEPVLFMNAWQPTCFLSTDSGPTSVVETSFHLHRWCHFALFGCLSRAIRNLGPNIVFEKSIFCKIKILSMQRDSDCFFILRASLPPPPPSAFALENLVCTLKVALSRDYWCKEKKIAKTRKKPNKQGCLLLQSGTTRAQCSCSPIRLWW